LTASLDGRYLYAGWESPLSTDGDVRGSHLLRIQRYRGAPGGQYIPDRQYAYLTDPGLHLSELAVISPDRLLALEREYIADAGNTVRIFDVRLRGAPDVTRRSSPHHEWSSLIVDRKLVFDLADCPPGSPGAVDAPGPQANPLLGNVEGMALGAPLKDGPHADERPLYLVSDDNGSTNQITRIYGLVVDLD
jgi:Esterase-like activity of phytase